MMKMTEAKQVNGWKRLVGYVITLVGIGLLVYSIIKPQYTELQNCAYLIIALGSGLSGIGQVHGFAKELTRVRNGNVCK